MSDHVDGNAVIGALSLDTAPLKMSLKREAAAWKNQYSFTHSTVPESPRAKIDSLESIETLFVNKGHEKAKAN